MPEVLQNAGASMVIVVGGEKGGTGKTAISINLAVCMQYRGLEPLLIDGDKQRSTAKWAERRAQLAALPQIGALAEDTHPILCVEKRGDMLATILALKKKCDHIIVDVAGAETPQLRSAMTAADLLLSPLVPSLCDLDTAGELNHLVDVIRATGNKKLQGKIVLNKCATNKHEWNREKQEAEAELEPFGNLPIAETTIHYRNVFKRAYSMQRGVIELAIHPNKKVQKAAEKATLEIWKLYQEVTGDPVLEELFPLHEVEADEE